MKGWDRKKSLGKTQSGTEMMASKVPVGSYKLKASKKGYKPWEKEIEVEADQINKLPIVLKPIQSSSQQTASIQKPEYKPPMLEEKVEDTRELVKFKQNGKWGFKDESGRVVIEPKYDYVTVHSEGLARVAEHKNGKDKWGFIDKSGRYAIEPKYDYVTVHSEGLAGVEVNGKWGFIDKSGRMIIEPKYDDASRVSFKGGLAKVEVNGKWGFIDSRGRMVIEPKFITVSDFDDGKAIGQINGKWGYIDMRGNWVTE